MMWFQGALVSIALVEMRCRYSMWVWDNLDKGTKRMMINLGAAELPGDHPHLDVTKVTG